MTEDAVWTTKGHELRVLFLEAIRSALEVPGLLFMEVGREASDVHIATRDSQTVVCVHLNAPDPADFGRFSFDVVITAGWGPIVYPAMLKAAKKLQKSGELLGRLNPIFR